GPPHGPASPRYFVHHESGGGSLESSDRSRPGDGHRRARARTIYRAIATRSRSIENGAVARPPGPQPSILAGVGGEEGLREFRVKRPETYHDHWHLRWHRFRQDNGRKSDSGNS